MRRDVGRGHSRLRPPVVVFPFVARPVAVTLAVNTDAQPQQILRRRATYRLRPPQVVGPGIAFHGPGVRLADPRSVLEHRWRDVTVALRPPQVVFRFVARPVSVYTAVRAEEPAQRVLRRAPTSVLSPPEVVFHAVEIYGPETTLARLAPQPTTKRLRPPTVISLAVEIYGPEVTVAPSRRPLTKSQLRPPLIDYTPGVELYGPKTTLAPSTRPLTRGWLRPPLIDRTPGAELYGPEVTLAPSTRPLTRSLLRQPLIDRTPGAELFGPRVVLAPSSRGTPKSRLYPPTTLCGLEEVLASDGANGDEFGYATALSRDGSTLVVGAYKAVPAEVGGVYVFRREDGAWAEQAKLTASDAADYDSLGWSVACSADGSTVFAVAPNKQVEVEPGEYGYGVVYAFTGADWATETQIPCDVIGASFGSADNNVIACSDDGTILVVGAPVNEFVEVCTGAGWATRTTLTASDATAGDNFGWSVACSADASVVVVGAYLEGGAGTERGKAYVYTGAWWVTETQLTASDTVDGDQFGYAVACSADGAAVLVGAISADGGFGYNGQAYLYTGTGWADETILTPAEAAGDFDIGQSVAVSSDGSRVAVGSQGHAAPDPYDPAKPGAVYLFENGSQTRTLNPPVLDTADLYMGNQVALSGDGSVLAAGAPQTDGDGPGSVFVIDFECDVTEPWVAEPTRVTLAPSVLPKARWTLRPPAVVAAAGVQDVVQTTLTRGRPGPTTTRLRPPVVVSVYAVYGPRVRLTAPLDRVPAVTSLLRAPAVVAYEAAAAPTVRLVQPPRPTARWRLAPPAVVFVAVEIYGPEVTLAPSVRPTTRSLLRTPVIDRTPGAELFGPETTLAPSTRPLTRSLLRQPTIDRTPGVELFGPEVTLAPSTRPLVRGWLRQPVIDRTPGAELYGPEVTLAPSTRPRTRSRLQPPTVVFPFVARPTETTFAPQPKAATRSRLRPPVVVLEAKPVRPLIVRLVGGRAGKATSKLSPPVVVYVGGALGGTLTSLARITPPPVLSVLGRPSVVTGAAELFGPETTLARITPTAAVARLQPPTVVFVAVEIYGPETALTRVAPQPTTTRLAPPTVVFVAVELLGPEVTLAPSRRPTTRAWLRQPLIYRTPGVELYGPEVTLAPSRRPRTASLLRPPVIDRTPGVELYGPETTLAPSRRPRTASLLRPPVISRAAGVEVYGPEVTLARVTPSPTVSALKQPTVVFQPPFAPVAVTLAAAARPTTRSLLKPPTVVFVSGYAAATITLARITPPPTISRLTPPAVTLPAFVAAPVSVTLVTLRPPPVLSALKPPTVTAEYVFVARPIAVWLAPSSRGRPRSFWIRRAVPYRPGDICGSDRPSGHLVCGEDHAHTRICYSEHATDSVTGTSATASRISGEDRASSRIYGSDRKAT